MKNTPQHPQRDHRSGGQALMNERLQLTDQQAEKFQQIRSEHFRRTRPLQEEMHRLRMDLLDELFTSQQDEETIQKMLTNLEQLQGQFEGNLLRHFRELRDVCQPQQTEELRLMLIDLVERTRPRDPEHRRPGPNGRMQPSHPPPHQRQ